MSKKRMTRRVFAVVFALLFMITGVTIPTLTPQAATEMDLSSYITMSGKTEAAKDNGENKGRQPCEGKQIPKITSQFGL